MRGIHWLSITLDKAGIPGTDRLALEASSPPDTAWAKARDATGLDDEALASHVASRFHLRLADLGNAAPTAAVLVPESVARKHRVVPVHQDDREIVVATADPTDLGAEQAVAFASGRQVIFEVASPAAIDAALARMYAPHGSVDTLMARVDAERADSVRLVRTEIEGAVARADVGESASVIRLTNLILRTALDHGASALEIAIDDGAADVSLRIDGVWSRLMPLPVPAVRHVLKRLAVLGNVGMANRAWARDGSARIKVQGRIIDLRITTLDDGVRQGRRIRFFDQQFTPRLSGLGLEADVEAKLRDLMEGEGLVLVAGPAGSGVTTLQYALLREIAARGRRVVLLEDGLRWAVDRVEHVEVTDATRASTLRTLGTRAIEVLGVDSADDPETARAAAEVIVPGRLVLLRASSDAASIALAQLLTRIGARDASREPIAVSVRLVRRACDGCGGDGCEACRRTGYRGALPLVSVLEPGASAGDESALLGAAGRVRVQRGETLPGEVARVLRAAQDPAAMTRPTRVLVVDDDPLIRLLARTVLETDGLEALEAEDGVAAFELMARRSDVDVLVLDLDMPRLDGHGVLAMLKRDLRTAGLPVIVLTGSHDPADETRVLEQGAADYIRKPIDPARFQARVRAVLRRHSG